MNYEPFKAPALTSMSTVFRDTMEVVILRPDTIVELVERTKYTYWQLLDVQVRGAMQQTPVGFTVFKKSKLN